MLPKGIEGPLMHDDSEDDNEEELAEETIDTLEGWEAKGDPHSTSGSGE